MAARERTSAKPSVTRGSRGELAGLADQAVDRVVGHLVELLDRAGVVAGLERELGLEPADLGVSAARCWSR